MKAKENNRAENKKTPQKEVEQFPVGQAYLR
jgi:hypothetical protein